LLSRSNEDRVADPHRCGVVRGHEARFLVGELLVKGLAGYGRALEHVGYAGFAEGARAEHVHRCFDQASALVM
jgi:hypothetical protein